MTMMVNNYPVRRRAGMGEVDNSSTADKIMDALTKALLLHQQEQVFKANLELAKQGRPMISSDILAQSTPGIPINLAVPQSTERNMMVMFGIGIGVLALVMLMKKR